MSKECEIIRDLLPLYAEGLTSKASNEWIEEHLNTCPECTKLLEQMRQTPQMEEIETEKEMPLKALSKTYRRKNRSLAVLIAAIAASVLISIYAWLSAPRYLTYEQAVARTEETADGVRVFFTDAVHHIHTESYTEAEDGSVYTDLECWTSTLDSLWHAETQSDVQLKGDVICFRDNKAKADGETDVILHGSPDTQAAVLRRLSLNYYLLMAAALTLILGVIRALVHDRKASDLITEIAMVSLSWCIATVIVEREISAATWSLTRDFSLIALLCASLSTVMISLFHRRRERNSIPVVS